MGTIPDCCLCVALAFCNSWVDISGPFDAYSKANKRVTIKIWYMFFCSSVTGAKNIRVMEDYSSLSSIAAFIRFACRLSQTFNA